MKRNTGILPVRLADILSAGSNGLEAPFGRTDWEVCIPIIMSLCKGFDIPHTLHLTSIAVKF
jgi:hypothetical protein